MSVDILGTSRDQCRSMVQYSFNVHGKPEGLLGRTAQDGHLDSHTAPELRFTFSHASLLKAVDGVMSVALCPQVVSQAPSTLQLVPGRKLLR